MKRAIAGRQFESSDEIVTALAEIFSEVGKERLCLVMEEWKHRLRIVIETHVEYYTA